MAQHLKRWESPRRRGRNSKGKGGAARKRQYLKQQQRLRQRLKSSDLKSSDLKCSNKANDSEKPSAYPPKRGTSLSFFVHFCGFSSQRVFAK
ncbi:MAG: hypothetical protein AAGF66_19190 [Cyanobacteria bacterium P01_H01_bin.119]